MAIEVLREHEYEGSAQVCIKIDCSCGVAKIFPFQKIKARERMTCPNCGCVSSFSAVWIDKIETELAS